MATRGTRWFACVCDGDGVNAGACVPSTCTCVCVQLISTRTPQQRTRPESQGGQRGLSSPKHRGLARDKRGKSTCTHFARRLWSARSPNRCLGWAAERQCGLQTNMVQKKRKKGGGEFKVKSMKQVKVKSTVWHHSFTRPPPRGRGVQAHPARVWPSFTMATTFTASESDPPYGV